MSINGFSSALADTIYGVSQGFILGPLLFLVYINDLNCAIKYKVHHFADDINLMNFQASIKTINRQINYDLKKLLNWLNANKIALNVSKAELIMFNPSKGN